MACHDHDNPVDFWGSHFPILFFFRVVTFSERLKGVEDI
jgi:hypothetical protein